MFKEWEIVVLSVVFGYFRSFFRSFFTSDSSDKIVMTFYLKSHLFISSATSQPILRWSHHRSRHCDAPASPMIIVFILVTPLTRARRRPRRFEATQNQIWRPSCMHHYLCSMRQHPVEFLHNWKYTTKRCVFLGFYLYFCYAWWGFVWLFLQH